MLMTDLQRVVFAHMPDPNVEGAVRFAERWQEFGFTDSEADAWLRAGSRLRPVTAVLLTAVGITPQEAFEPFEGGDKITSDTLYSLVEDKKLSPKVAGEFAAERRAPSQARLVV